MFKFLSEEVAAMGAIVTELLYFAISGALVATVGQVLSRSGRAFLSDGPGGPDGAACPASRLLAATFYLLSMGFVALTAPSWSHVTSPARAAGLLTGKAGVLLLVLGVLFVASTAVLARLRRARSWAPPAQGGGADDLDTAPGSGAVGGRRDVAAAPALWQRGRVVH
jgi:hypothetical protein